MYAKHTMGFNCSILQLRTKTGFLEETNQKSTICTSTPNLKLSKYVCFTLGFQVFSCSIGGVLLEETIEAW